MRSTLRVPASRPGIFDEAMKGEADALCFDLAEAVDEQRKGEARDAVARFLRALPPNCGKTIVVRVNGLETSHFAADLEAVVGPGLDIVNLPTCESADDVRELAGALARLERKVKPRIEPVGILPDIESPRALRLAADIALAGPRVVGLQAGWGDLIEPLGIERRSAATIEAIQLQVRIAAGEAGVWAYDGAWADIEDPEAYRREAEQARRLGYLGKSAIHPAHVPIANAVFRPTDHEIARALRVVEAARVAAEKGTVDSRLEGRRIDASFVRRAEAILELARRLNLLAAEERSIQ
jgi:citrate lyase subunit beta/citryl-CoA lyase